MSGHYYINTTHVKVRVTFSPSKLKCWAPFSFSFTFLSYHYMCEIMRLPLAGTQGEIKLHWIKSFIFECDNKPYYKQLWIDPGGIKLGSLVLLPLVALLFSYFSLFYDVRIHPPRQISCISEQDFENIYNMGCLSWYWPVMLTEEPKMVGSFSCCFLRAGVIET
jgi:hypothetical protein